MLNKLCCQNWFGQHKSHFNSSVRGSDITTHCIVEVRNTCIGECSPVQFQNWSYIHQTQRRRPMCVTHLFVSLLPPSEARPVVISKAQEVVIRDQPLNGVTHHVNIDGLALHPKPTGKELTHSEKGANATF